MIYYIRLDDSCEYQNNKNWNRIEEILLKYSVTPLVGMIPDCKDPNLIKYGYFSEYLTQITRWKRQGWMFALHGYHHTYTTSDGGMNPIHQRSEFAGIDFDKQKEMIRSGINILKRKGIHVNVFFAPSHTFDLNTIKALRDEGSIRCISDTIAIKPYKKYGIIFMPQQLGRVRKILFGEITFCYHPNEMTETDFENLEKFLNKYHSRFRRFQVRDTQRRRSLLDVFLSKSYFMFRKLRGVAHG